MARPFSIEAASSRFNLPPVTRDQVRALMLDLDLNAVDVVVRAVSELFRRELGATSERDVYAELDELKAALVALANEAE